MSKRGLCLLAALCLLLCAQGALAEEAYSFPYAGIHLRAQEGWTVLAPGMLEREAALLERLGVDTQTLAADYAASHTIFEVYLPEGMQVSLAAVQTEQSAVWGELAGMTEAQKEAFAAALHRPPYENAGWSEDVIGFLRYEWMLEAGGIPVSFAGLMTVRQGALYTLTAGGAALPMDALHAANLRVLEGLTFLGLPEDGMLAAGAQAIVGVEDDGVATPIEMVAFSPITYEEDTVLTLRTLPGAELLLKTANDTLRGRAGEDGLHSYTVSTKRETVYRYTLTAQAEGRASSVLEIAVERQRTPEEQRAAYRKACQPLSAYGYERLLDAPEDFGEKPVTFEGRVGGFVEIGGFPCALVYTEDLEKSVWQKPLCVLLTEAIALAAGDGCTVYGDIRGDALAYEDMTGRAGMAPVVICREIDR